ncbi:MAG: nitroreductase family protein [Candidatus Eisenbacteria sp.]|nr:nitroreductase family protein [Candidatus Eisenbacteria bacterium]
MEFYEVIRTRHSVRRFSHRPVEEEKLQRILNAARLAPSARNAQEWRFIVVRDSGRRAALMEAARGQAHVAEAPLIITACAEHDGRTMTCGQLAYPVDVAIAVDHLTLAARAEGLGSCWICRFDERRAKEALNVPRGDQVRIVTLVPIGYPAAAAVPEKLRLPLESIVRSEHW